MQDNRAVQKNYEPELINVTRNPYLLDYEEQRRRPVQRQSAERYAGQPSRRPAQTRGAYGQEVRQPVQPTRRPAQTRGAYGQEVRQPGQPTRRPAQTRGAYGQEMRQPGQPTRRPAQTRGAYGQEVRQPVQPTRRPAGRTGEVQPLYYAQEAGRPRTQGGRQNREAMLRERRRRQQRRQKIAVGIWAVCIIAVSAVLFLNRSSASAAGSGRQPGNAQSQGQDAASGTSSPNVSGTVIQGLPAEKFTAHPEWTEDFLTPNEYSRPGEALPEVKDVFVHYTANPGTSAAQNRSYFEQQKDVHMASVSAHFIIGYEGEIIQCVPLDEIAYAVAGRNYDSVSIECCYTAKDGSFTQETYDSLISLLAWLTDAYGLDTSHILRHYDAGGKKCPIYYTENVDEWEQLKQDVKAYKK